MNIRSKLLILFFITVLAFGCSNENSNHSAQSHGGSVEEEQPKGPHGGKLFEKDGFAIEVTIYEPDIPPQSRIYVYQDKSPIDPSSVTLITELHRIDRIDTIRYSKQDDYLLGDIIVEEPHSFDVKLKAIYKNKEYTWSYSSYEGRTTLSPEAIKSIGIETDKAKAALIKSTLVFNGRVEVDKFKAATLTARYPGIIKEIRKFPGAKIDKGDVIATIESNESLKVYDLVAPRSGEVLALNVAVGELVGTEEPVATLGDLSSVWIELTVPIGEFSKLKVGQKVLIDTHIQKEASETLEGKIIYLSPLADSHTQTRLARVEVLNRNQALTPGLFVVAKAVVQERVVPVAIAKEGLQTFRDWDVVFKKVGHNFEIAILELGETDGDFIEIKAGLAPGTEYVTKNSFVVKADVMKSGAAHDH